MSSYDKTFKILFLSDPEVDKSVMFSGYLTYSPQPDDHNTIGIEFHLKTLVIDKKKYKLQFWDLTEMERFRFLLPTYCLGANAAVLLYDVTRSQTSDNIGEWANIVRQKGGDIPIMLVGIIPNEKKERQVSTEQGKEIAKLKNLNGFIECSIKTKENVEQVFEVLTRLMVTNKGYNFVIAKKRDDRFSLKSKERTKISSPKIPSKPPLSPPPPPPPKPPGTPAMAPQGRESYPYPIISSHFLNWSRGARWIRCSNCRRKFTKEKFFTHSCKIKGGDPGVQRRESPVSLRGAIRGELRQLFSRRARSEQISGSEAVSQLGSTSRPTATTGDKIDPQLKGEVQSFLEWIKDSEGLSGYIIYYLLQNNTTIISELSKIYLELRQIFGV